MSCSPPQGRMNSLQQLHEIRLRGLAAPVFRRARCTPGLLRIRDRGLPDQTRKGHNSRLDNREIRLRGLRSREYPSPDRPPAFEHWISRSRTDIRASEGTARPSLEMTDFCRKAVEAPRGLRCF